MAKDVDLTSKEWTDIVFEGKNKEFGAYTLRSDSPRRHTKSVLVVLGVIALIIIGLILKIKADEIAAAEAEAQQDMQAVEVGTGDEIEEEEDEMVQEIPEEPEPEIPEEVQEEEEVTATQQLTELKMVDVVDKEKEQKDPDEVLADTKVLGSENREGLEDIDKKAVIEDVVEKKPEPVAEKPKDEGPVSVAMVEQKPQFPGGEAAMMKWISDNMNYPAQAAEEGVSGKVTVQFIVEKDGSVSHVKVARGKHPALDQEAVRVVKKMPKWVPGRNNGAPVRVTYLLPVTFRLQQ